MDDCQQGFPRLRVRKYTSCSKVEIAYNYAYIGPGSARFRPQNELHMFLACPSLTGPRSMCRKAGRGWELHRLTFSGRGGTATLVKRNRI